MYRFLLSGMVVSALALATVTPLSADDAAEWKALSGEWVVVKVESEGDDLTGSFANVTLSITKGTYSVVVAKQEDRGTLEINASAKPKSMDITGIEGPNRGRVFPCLYEIKDGQLTVAYGLDFKTRPKNIETKAKSGTMRIEYKKKNGG